MSNLLLRAHMGGRFTQALCLLSLFILTSFLPSSATATDDWRSVEIDPGTWTDGPIKEGSPMDESYYGDPVFAITVDYVPAHFASRTEGVIIIELFPQWAPITVENMVEHIEEGIYDGIFFHRVIDDFVTQSGDPTCTTQGAYPLTTATCGSGGTGETIPLEHNENLSHVDGAIGMARSQDPDSADSQWYIAETEAHGLDPENRDDEGYATFGVVRDGMTHVRAIAETPTTDDPSGDPDIQNPASSAGRPIYEVHISSIEMIGIAAPQVEEIEEEDEGLTMGQIIARSGGFLLLVTIALGAAFMLSKQVKTDLPANLDEEKTEESGDKILVAELLD
ncbi:MAG: hypothetical protein CMB73_04300 [Euryarchaeota archaeon]|nr:hypothetical protein [Euryarchaeota archaeon]